METFKEEISKGTRPPLHQCRQFISECRVKGKTAKQVKKTHVIGIYSFNNSISTDTGQSVQSWKTQLLKSISLTRFIYYTFLFNLLPFLIIVLIFDKKSNVISHNLQYIKCCLIQKENDPSTAGKWCDRLPQTFQEDIKILYPKMM